MSVRYTRAVVESLKDKGWIIERSLSGKRKRYKLIHHRCDEKDVPLDRDGKPLKFSVPRGDGGPFERLYTADISWKACLAWIVYKLYSDWKTGETYPCTMLEHAKRCRFAPNTVVLLIQELVDADMLYRLSQPHEKSVFQLFPRPHRKDDQSAAKPVELDDGVTSDGKFWYSSGSKYRCCRETTDIYFKVNRAGGTWKLVPDRDRHKIPFSVRLEFEGCIKAKKVVEQAFW